MIPFITQSVISNITLCLSSLSLCLSQSLSFSLYTCICCTLFLSFTLSLFIHPSMSHSDFGSEMESSQQSGLHQGRVTEHEEQMPRWKHCAESVPTRGLFLHTVWQTLQTSDRPFDDICNLALDASCYLLYSTSIQLYVSLYTIKLHGCIKQVEHLFLGNSVISPSEFSSLCHSSLFSLFLIVCHLK